MVCYKIEIVDEDRVSVALLNRLKSPRVTKLFRFRKTRTVRVVVDDSAPGHLEDTLQLQERLYEAAGEPLPLSDDDHEELAEIITARSAPGDVVSQRQQERRDAIRRWLDEEGIRCVEVGKRSGDENSDDDDNKDETVAEPFLAPEDAVSFLISWAPLRADTVCGVVARSQAARERAIRSIMSLVKGPPFLWAEHERDRVAAPPTANMEMLKTTNHSTTTHSISEHAHTDQPATITQRLRPSAAPAASSGDSDDSSNAASESAKQVDHAAANDEKIDTSTIDTNSKGLNIAAKVYVPPTNSSPSSVAFPTTTTMPTGSIQQTTPPWIAPNWSSHHTATTTPNHRHVSSNFTGAAGTGNYSRARVTTMPMPQKVSISAPPLLPQLTASNDNMLLLHPSGMPFPFPPPSVLMPSAGLPTHEVAYAAYATGMSGGVPSVAPQLLPPESGDFFGIQQGYLHPAAVAPMMSAPNVLPAPTMTPPSSSSWFHPASSHPLANSRATTATSQGSTIAGNPWNLEEKQRGQGVDADDEQRIRDVLRLLKDDSDPEGLDEVEESGRMRRSPPAGVDSDDDDDDDAEMMEWRLQRINDDKCSSHHGPLKYEQPTNPEDVTKANVTSITNPESDVVYFEVSVPEPTPAPLLWAAVHCPKLLAKTLERLLCLDPLLRSGASSLDLVPLRLHVAVTSSSSSVASASAAPSDKVVVQVIRCDVDDVDYEHGSVVRLSAARLSHSRMDAIQAMMQRLPKIVVSNIAVVRGPVESSLLSQLIPLAAAYDVGVLVVGRGDVHLVGLDERDVAAAVTECVTRFDICDGRTTI